MALKHLLVHLDESGSTPRRIDIAARLAGAHDAYLTGLYMRKPEWAMRPNIYDYDGGSSEFVARMADVARAEDEERRKAQEALLDQFTRAAATARVSASPHVETAADHSEIIRHLIGYARLADVAVLGMTENERNMPHDVLFAAGVPIIVVPPDSSGDIGRRILIGWNGSAESARATRDALPILAKAETVTVLCIDGVQAGANVQPGEDVARHLGRHGIEAAVINAARGKLTVGDAILSRASDLGADMLVMGAYGHSRLREYVLGGVTKRILERTTLPVMMSH